MRMKRVVSILAAAVLVFGLTGCNAITIDGETENASGEMSGNGSIGFSVSTLKDVYKRQVQIHILCSVLPRGDGKFPSEASG